MGFEPHFRRVAIAALILTAAWPLTACTGGSDATPTQSALSPSASPIPSPEPTPTVEPAVAEATAAVLDAYQGFWAAKVAWYADPTQVGDAGLSTLATDTALADAGSTVFSLKDSGIRVSGEPVLTPVVSEVELGNAATAKITDCVDIANWQAIFTATGENAGAPNQFTRVLTESTAVMFDGRWLIRSSESHRDRTC